jgi:hypothetical protein
MTGVIRTMSAMVVIVGLHRVIPNRGTVVLVACRLGVVRPIAVNSVDGGLDRQGVCVAVEMAQPAARAAAQSG